MTSERETETNLESGSPPYLEQPVRAEAAYERLTSYGFARRYVKGKAVADIDLEGVGYGSRLLAGTAESVAGLTTTPETSDRASVVYSAPNVTFRTVELPDLPFSDSSFDVVVAFGLVEELENPEDLVKEAKRILKEDGVLLISAADRQTNTVERGRTEVTDGRQEMYVRELQDMLERHFEHVRIYRQGAVAGGFVFPASGEVNDTPVEVARFSVADHVFGVGSPLTRSVITVCSDAAGALADEEQPYLLLDRDRGVFDESEERAEDVELLQAEIQRMQETEVQAFIDAIKVRQTLIQELPRYLPFMRHILIEHLIHRRNIIRGNIYAMRKKGAIGLARGAFRRSSALYRRLRTRGSE